jgi:solute carrier family 35 protein F5
MLKTSPLIVTLGLSLTIPCAILGDVFEGTPLGGWKTGVGAFLVVLGFIGAPCLIRSLRRLTGVQWWG